MFIISNRFDHPEAHHPKWFRVFWAKRQVEVWFGKRYISMGLD